MANTGGVNLFEALKPVMEDLGIDVNAVKSVTFHIGGYTGENTYSVEMFVTDEADDRLQERMNPNQWTLS